MPTKESLMDIAVNAEPKSDAPRWPNELDPTPCARRQLLVEDGDLVLDTADSKLLSLDGLDAVTRFRTDLGSPYGASDAHVTVIDGTGLATDDFDSELNRRVLTEFARAHDLLLEVRRETVSHTPLSGRDELYTRRTYNGSPDSATTRWACLWFTTAESNDYYRRHPGVPNGGNRSHHVLHQMMGVSLANDWELEWGAASPDDFWESLFSRGVVADKRMTPLDQVGVVRRRGQGVPSVRAFGVQHKSAYIYRF